MAIKVTYLIYLIYHYLECNFHKKFQIIVNNEQPLSFLDTYLHCNALNKGQMREQTNYLGRTRHNLSSNTEYEGTKICISTRITNNNKH